MIKRLSHECVTACFHFNEVSAEGSFRRLRTATGAPRPRTRRLLKKAGENFNKMMLLLSDY